MGIAGKKKENIAFSLIETGNFGYPKEEGMRIAVDETKDLLARAGYVLSPCDKRDIIFSFFIEREIYDMIELDIVLEEHDLPCFIE